MSIGMIDKTMIENEVIRLTEYLEIRNLNHRETKAVIGETRDFLTVSEAVSIVLKNIGDKNANL